jgi:hypothetical protein
VKQETTATELTFCDKFLQALKMASGPYKASRDAYVAAGALILLNTKTVDIEQERVSNTPHDSHAVSNHVGCWTSSRGSIGRHIYVHIQSQPRRCSQQWPESRILANVVSTCGVYRQESSFDMNPPFLLPLS